MFMMNFLDFLEEDELFFSPPRVILQRPPFLLSPVAEDALIIQNQGASNMNSRSVAYPENRNRLIPYEQRKENIIQKIHGLPLKVQLNFDNYEKWTSQKLIQTLENEGVHRKDLGRLTRSKLVHLLRSHIAKRGSDCETCAVCCDDYTTDDVLRTLNCGHSFHVECVDTWAVKACAYSKPPTCPVCKKDI